MPKLKFLKKDFQNFLDGLGRVSDSIILKVEPDKVYAIASSEDRSMFLRSMMEGDFNLTQTFNLPSVKKLSKALSLVPDNEIEFIINTNNLEYKGKGIRFKYHLYAEGILIAPRINQAKIESLEYDYEFGVDKTFITYLLKNSSIFKDTNKLYLYTQDDHLVWSLGDKTMTNTDDLVITGDEVDFELEESFIMNLDNVRLIKLNTNSEIKFFINKMGIGNIQLQNDNVQLNYIISSLTN